MIASGPAGGLPCWVGEVVRGDGDCLSECPRLSLSIRTLWLAFVSPRDDVTVQGFSGSLGR